MLLVDRAGAVGRRRGGQVQTAGDTGAVPDEDIAFAHESAATGQTAKRMARATLGLTLRRTRFYIWLSVVLLLLTALIFLAYEGDGLTPGARLLGSIFWAAVIAPVVLLMVCVLGYVTNLRNFRRTVPPGTVQRTGFGRDEFVTANALSSSRFSYRAVHSVQSHGGFVFIRFVGQPVVRVYPQKLFPHDAMTRLRDVTSRRGGGGPSA